MEGKPVEQSNYSKFAFAMRGYEMFSRKTGKRKYPYEVFKPDFQPILDLLFKDSHPDIYIVKK